MIARPIVLRSVAGLIAMLFALTNLPWQLDDYDQAKQAFTSFEMVQEGHWFYQHTPNEKIATKPPLVGWISAGCYALTRSWEIAWRLPSLAAALLLLALLTRAAGRAYGEGAALIAMAAFGLHLLSPRLATLVRTDMPLALVIFMLGWKIWEKIRTTDPWRTGDRFVMFALLTAAMLIKGPIAYAFLLPGIVLFQWTGLDSKKYPNAWCGWWPWIASLLIFLLWVAGGIAWVPHFYEEVVLREFAGRFGETVHRPQPLYFYFPHLLHKFAPWSFLLLGLAIVAWKAKASTFRERYRNLSPEVRWLILWSLGGLVVMSLIPSKRVDRIFPIVPPLCLLLAAQFARLTSDVRFGAATRRWAAVALIFGCVFSSGYAVQKVVRGYRAGAAALVDFGAAVRNQAEAKGWRYEVIGGKEEGLLLYLRRTHFIKHDEAIARWKADELDALVLSAEDAAALISELPGSTPTGLEASIRINGRERRYLFLKRATL